MSGLIHIYTGDGKGKTTAAMGLAVRFAGNGGKVLLTQMLKDGSSSELCSLRAIPGIDCFSFEKHHGFVFRMSQEEKEAAKADYAEYFSQITERIRTGNYGLLILDEMIAASNHGFVPVEDLLAFLQEKPDGLEVVMTGRNPDSRLVEIADYVTEMKKNKHPFDQGIVAREGIEF